MKKKENMCTNRHVKTGKTLLEFPSCPPVERVTDYELQGREDRDTTVKNPDYRRSSTDANSFNFQ